jgi:hypothetical protein
MGQVDRTHSSPVNIANLAELITKRPNFDGQATSEEPPEFLLPVYQPKLANRTTVQLTHYCGPGVPHLMRSRCTRSACFTLDVFGRY